ncbi:MAG: hypothetical protein R3F41_16265 [Gammaproteobacteria bacterium]|nr:hypothetical protein [Pseudomonadales bacterium]MCP5346674.1 hypothetical protein [Pseudomonadales bacterium]
MRIQRSLVFGLTIFTLALASCDRVESDSADMTQPATGPAGFWENRYQDAIGQSYLNVMEQRDDGSYATFMQDSTPDDHGRYSLAGGVLRLQSEVDPRYSRSLPYQWDGDTLKLSVEPFPGAGFITVTVEWQRSAALPAFETFNSNGDELPVDLPGLVASALVSHALAWHEDALPVSLDIRISPPGRRTRLTLEFFSPSTVEGLRLDLYKYVFSSRVIDGSRMRQQPLPAGFVDLSDILRIAESQGLSGRFQRADLRTYVNAGPAWMILPQGPRGATYSAISGERIEGDVTGYISQYEADWTRNAEIWRQVFERYASCPAGQARDRLFGGGCMNARTSGVCAEWGGRWVKQGPNLDDGYCTRWN